MFPRTDLKILLKAGVFKNLLGGDMHSHERLLVFSFVSACPDVRMSGCLSGYLSVRIFKMLLL